MKLICFPHYTCGGFLCDIMTDTISSTTSNGGIDNPNHNMGKIGDSDSIFFEYSVEEFMQKIQDIQDKDCWVATHCHPQNLPLDEFQKIINVTTTTYRSKIYRWARCFHLYYANSQPWQLQGQQLIDKQRETAKNYLIPSTPVIHQKVTNLEFSDVVEFTNELLNAIRPYSLEKHMTRWKKSNDFLYDLEFWNSVPAQRFYEAEFETNLQRHYIYK